MNSPGKTVYLISVMILSFSIQSALISNGLLGVTLISLKKLCTCDHSLEKSHTHANQKSEDSIFSTSTAALSGIIRLKRSIPQDNLPDPEEICHTPASVTEEGHAHHGENPSQPHFCPHETSKQNVENTALALNILQSPDVPINISKPLAIILYTTLERKIAVPSGFSNPPYEPPQSI
ncbi:MAG: hypothetical protein JJT78_02270 [Leptospira sp.]|nr:hypothetical protein [Leptospira sp.]